MRFLPLLALLFLLAAFPGSAGAQGYGLASRPAFSAFNGGTLPPNADTISGTWSTVPAWPGLTFQNPMGIVQQPGTQSMIVWEREGRMWRFDKATGANKTKILDLTAHCQGWDDSGLMNMVFHPNFASNRYVFIYYTWVPTGNVQGSATVRPPTYKINWDRLSRFTMNPDGSIDASSELVLIHQKSETLWHNGSGMFFHPANGFLYLINGDDFIPERAQTLTRGLHSGIFRIDVAQVGGTTSHPIPRQPLPAATTADPNTGSYSQNYYIPNDNPLVGQTGVLEEYIALGVRSPHRMTLDPVTGRIFHSDVGDASREEINVIEPGDIMPNYQWPKFEGLVGDMTAPYIGLNKKPLLDYTHADGSAAIGGYVYRGNQFPELKGKYIFGDNMVGTIWYLDESTSPATKVPICKLPNGPGPNPGDNYAGLSTFGLDADGELYLCQLSSTAGGVYKLSRTGGNTNTLPATLSATNLFSDLATLTPNTGILAYDVNTPLWSDNAHKQRWFAVPTGQRIGYSPTGEWSFPAGSVFVKHFELNTDETNPTQRRRLETRVMVRDNRGYVYGATYKWRSDSSDADLISNSESEDITITTAGAPRVQRWLYPGRQACLNCHTPASKGVLGLNTPQNHRDHVFTETGITDNQLRAWSHVGYFTPAIDEGTLAGLQRFAAISDNSATVEQRVRSYLDSNCSHCHRPGGSARGYWDARIETSLANAGIINGSAVNELGMPGAKIITPQNVAASLLHLRLSTAGEGYSMPPIAKALVDTDAVALLETWINSLQPPSPNPLPAPWLAQNLGNVAQTGGGTSLSDAFTLKGMGDDIGGTADGMLFVSRDLTGDGQLIARIASFENENPSTEAGVMIRETLLPASKQAATLFSPGDTMTPASTAFVTRNGSLVGNISSGAAPWLRIRRTGNVFVSSISADGYSWNEIGRQTIVMTAKVKIGVCLSAHSNAQYATVRLDNIQYMPTVPWMVDSQPQSQLVKVGDLVDFGIETVGDQPTGYQWRKNNTNIVRAVEQRYAFNAVLASAGSYNVLTGGKLLSNTANLAVVDKAVFTTNLAPGATATFTLGYAGTGVSFLWTKDGVPIPASTRIIGPATGKLTVTKLTTADIGDYECVVSGYGSTFVLGPYHLHVLSKPTITAPPPPDWTVSRAFEWQLTADEPVSGYVVSKLPSGLVFNAVTGKISGTPNVGGEFPITVYAKNAAGNGPVHNYTLKFESFPSLLSGNFAGLVNRSALTNELGGSLTLTVATTGAVTGRITLGAAAYALIGRAQFVSGSDPTVSFPLKTTPASTLTLTLHASDGTITGDLAGTLVTARHLVRSGAAGYAGVYNISLDQTSTDLSQPQGSGWARAVLSSAAVSTFSGRMADNTLIIGSATVRDDGSLAWHQLMYANKGSIQGLPVVTSPTMGGSLSWKKNGPSSASDRIYAAGFPLVSLVIDGVKFAAISPGSTFLGLTAAKIDFADGGIGTANKPNQSFTFTTAHKAVFSTDYININPNYDTLAITPSTGYFTGTVKLKDGAIPRTLTYQGVFLTGRSTARGAFTLIQLPANTTAPYLSGSVSIHAPP